MNITQRILIATVAVSVLFIILLSVLFTISANTAADVQSLILDSQTDFVVLETLSESINRDALLLDEFLGITDHSQAVVFSQRFSENIFVGDDMTIVIRDEVIQDDFRNQQAVLQYQNATQLLLEMTLVRERLLQIHKEELETNRDLTIQKISEYRLYQQLSTQANSLLLESIRLLNQDSQDFQNRLINQSTSLYYWIAFFFILFLIISSVSAQQLVSRIGKPLDDMSVILKTFTQGDYTARVGEESPITEIKELQQEINSVLTVITEEVSSNEKKKQEVQLKLLPAQLKDILHYISQRTCEQKITTMKDIKKEFHLTYPTVQNRVTQLEEKGYLVVKKEGRDKQLFLTQ